MGEVPKQLVGKGFKKGVSGNPKGRPKGKTMKEFAREFLLKMDDEEKVKWLKSLGKDMVWRMAEGNPQQHTDITSGGEKVGSFNYITPNESNDNSDSETGQGVEDI